MNVKQYLQRIQIKEDPGLNLESLAGLQEQHVLSIPFENLDVMNGVPIPLNVQAYFNKIIKKDRGGFCYELNGLFHWLLGELGFSNYLIACTVRSGGNRWAIPESHASQIVELDQPYLVDVGFGDTARIPLPLTGEVRKDISGNFRVVESGDGYFHKQKKVEGEWVTRFRFLNKERQLEDFAEVCHYNQSSPDSHFTQRRLVTMATPEGRLTLSGNTLTITENQERQKKEVEESQISKLLVDKFGISIRN